ncbi:hypothetical protein H0H93_006387, partial [Arthromyces matolae]
MTCTLTHLPTELLQLVASYLQLPSFSSPIFRDHLMSKIDFHDRHDSIAREFGDASYALSALSRVSRAIRGPIEPLLYRQVVIASLTSRHGRKDTWGNAHLVLRTLQQRKDLTRYIRGLFVINGYNSIPMLLDLCKRLDLLIVSCMPKKSAFNICTTVQRLTIAYPPISIQHLFNLFPNLSTLELSVWSNPYETIPSHGSRLLLLPSPLRVLRFTALPHDIELHHIFSRIVHHFGGTLSNLYVRLDPFGLRPPDVREEPLPKYKPTGDALRVLHFEFCLFSEQFPHTPHILRDLRGLQHFKISFCIPLTPADFRRMPVSLRSLTLCDFGHVFPNHHSGTWGSYTPSLDEKGFIESLLTCLSSREVQSRSLNGIAILEGTPNETYPFKTPDFDPLRTFCENNGLGFYQRLQIEQDDDVVGRGIIQIL